MPVLGVKIGPFHDTGACLVVERDGVLRCTAIAQERLTRDKHSRRFPAEAIHACLDDQGVRLRDVELVLIDAMEQEETVADTAPMDALPVSRPRSAEQRAQLRALVGDIPIRLVNHHLAHAASVHHVFAPRMAHESAAILVVDGSGSPWPLDGGPERNAWFGPAERLPEYRLKLAPRRRRETQSLFVGRGRRLERVAVSCRSGVGHFFTYCSERVCGFAHLQEGKFMGLAGWGDAARAQRTFPGIPDAIFAGIDTPIVEHLMAIDFHAPLRAPDVPPTDPYYAALAWWAQDVLERAMLHLAAHARAATGCTDLGLAGGVALNIVANRRIRDAHPGALHIQPAASDAGIALGAALHGYYGVLGGTALFQDEVVALGRAHDEGAVAAAMASAGARRTDDVFGDVARRLDEGRIVGWFDGRAEHGPRALGHRSILCSPRFPWMKAHLNAVVKHREMFRPFAPLVREERVHECFDLDGPSPHMLLNAMVRPEHRDALPAVTHADGSGRVQTVGRRDHPRLSRLLEAFEALDPRGVLLNTSFNDAGEPIVETIDDAIRCWRTTGVEVLVAGDWILEKPIDAARAERAAATAATGAPA